MSKTYALVTPENTIREIRDDVDPNVPTRAGYRWLPYEKIDPSFSPDTQERSDKPTVKVEGGRVIEEFTVRNLTWEEIALRKQREKEDRIGGMDNVLLLVLWEQGNSIRVLQGKEPISLAQFRSFLRSKLP